MTSRPVASNLDAKDEAAGRNLPEPENGEEVPRNRPAGLCPVVAIGASAGGLEAYTEFFHALPADTGMAFVLVQHLDPSHRSMLSEIIAKATKLRVEEVKSGTKIKPGRVYVIPPNALMTIAAGVFKLTPRSKEPGRQLAINFFMRSLAQERKSRAVGIVLSGTGADGTLGLEDIKAEGGITFAQDPATAKYDGMPGSAIDSGCVDFVLPPKEIAKELRRIQRHPYVHQDEQDKEIAEAEVPSPSKGDFTRMIAELRRTSGVDFSQYKPNTIHRRALRRMMILKLDTLGEYAKHLKEHPEEGQKLYDDVLIPVTSFFRDFEAFEALKAQVYPAIVKDTGNKGAIRMWAPGCSTGEETYSLAMTLLEFLGDRASSFQVQIFGTDLNEKGIQHARGGVYRASIAEEISPERMRRFFVKVEEGYRVNKAVRDMCVFARQNLATDPPFSQMNVVACRNLLIYIQPMLQKKIIPILHYALRPSGFLVLGSSESVSAFPDLFSAIDKKHKIYAKNAVASRLHYDFAQSYYPMRSNREAPSKEPQSQYPAKNELDVQAEADRVVLKNHAPVGVVINSAMDVVQFRGRTTPYLEPAPGKPSLNVLNLARNGLAIELRTLIASAKKKDAPVSKQKVPFDGNGHRRMLNVSVSPLGEKGSRENRFFLILFEDVTPLWAPGPGDLRGRAKGDAETKRESKRLKQELGNAHNALRSAIESEDALREEFQSANEEILSANEELQSTNEELETSKEELQSANEEMNTLNAELRHKNTELHELSNDISNFLNSTRLPVVMLDRRLRIRRLTPTADKLLKVLPSDIGRPLSDIRPNIEAPGLEPHGLEQTIAKVLASLQPEMREVQDVEGHWHELNILPYQTQDNKIDGVVLALQDIDAVKSASEQLRKSSEFFRSVVDTVIEPLVVLDSELRVVMANAPFLSTFKVSLEQMVHRFLYDLGNGQWNIPKLRTLLEEVLPQRRKVLNFVVEFDFEGIGLRTIILNAQALSPAHDARPMILLAFEDITEREQADAALRESEERFRTLFESMDEGFCIIEQVEGESGAPLDFRYVVANPAFERQSGVGGVVGKTIRQAFPGEPEKWFETYEAIVKTGEPVRFERDLGTVGRTLDLYAFRIEDKTRRRVAVIFRDITTRKLNALAIARLASIVECSDDAIIAKDLHGIIQSWNRGAERLFGYTQREAIGQSITLLFPPDRVHEEPKILERIGRGEHIEHYESVRRRKDGELVDVSLTISPIVDAQGKVVGASKIARDITDRKLTEAALIKSEKLAAAGRLAATLAHEINNPLQAVTNLMTLLGQSTQLDTQGREYAAIATQELERVTHLTQQSLSFYRESSSSKAVNVEEVLEGILTLYGKQMDAKGIAVTKQYLSNESLNSYPGEIRQVFTTLLLNAMEAIPGGGRIVLRVRKWLAWDKPGIHGVRITIADTGVGIPAHNRARIFEPFFTTKGGHGTGLGLWVAQGIVSRLGGSVRMRSSIGPGKSGTCFSIFLPRQIPTKV